LSERIIYSFSNKKMADIAPLQPFTLAAFLPWGSSKGAGRVSRRKSKNSFNVGNVFIVKNE
jgi:hypothetical protein